MLDPYQKPDLFGVNPRAYPTRSRAGVRSASRRRHAGYKGVTAFVAEKGTPGFTVGRKEDKLGIRASSTCELIFDDCRLAAAQLLGAPGQGYKIAMETLNEGRIGIGAQMLGLAEGAWGYAVKYARERKQFGKPIAEFQAMQFQLAEMATDIEAARLMVYNAARLRDVGEEFRKEAAMCKYFASHTAERVASLAVEVFGGSGFVRDYPVEKAISRRQDRQDLRRNLVYAVGDDCQADAGVRHRLPEVARLGDADFAILRGHGSEPYHHTRDYVGCVTGGSAVVLVANR